MRARLTEPAERTRTHARTSARVLVFSDALTDDDDMERCQTRPPPSVSRGTAKASVAPTESHANDRLHTSFGKLVNSAAICGVSACERARVSVFAISGSAVPFARRGVLVIGFVPAL